MLPLLMEYSEFLLDLTANGLVFNVHDFHVEPLQKILNWTIRDMKNPGIDFTTNYAGSQIKHSFNLIVCAIHQCDPQLSLSRIVFFLHQKSQTASFNIRLVKLLRQNNIQEIIWF